MKFNIGDYITPHYTHKKLTRIWEVIGITNLQYRLRCVKFPCEYIAKVGDVCFISKMHINKSYRKCSDAEVIAKVI